MFGCPYDNPDFLEPHHHHDVDAISHISQPPRELLSLLPGDILPMITQVQDATSIVYASWQRLNDLFTDRFEHIFPSTTVTFKHRQSVQYSEPSFFHYRNQVEAERSYLLFEALTDWQFKVSRLEEQILFDPLLQLLVEPSPKSNGAIEHATSDSDSDPDTLSDSLYHWLSSLRTAILLLKDRAERTHVPDFESTTTEFEKSIRDAAAASQNKAFIKAADLDRRDSGIGLDSDIEEEDEGEDEEDDFDEEHEYDAASFKDEGLMIRVKNFGHSKASRVDDDDGGFETRKWPDSRRDSGIEMMVAIR